MSKYPMVEEARAARLRHATRFEYDLRKIAEDDIADECEDDVNVFAYDA